MYEEFVRNRITQLRLERGISEYKMSRDLGHSKSYIYNISSGKSLPPLKELFEICNYFNITLQEFFNENIEYPILINSIIEKSKGLDKQSLESVLTIMDNLK